MENYWNQAFGLMWASIAGLVGMDMVNAAYIERGRAFNELLRRYKNLKEER